MKTLDIKLLNKPLIIVAIIALLIRLALFLSYPPITYGDTPSYRRLAESVLNGFQHYDGTRTPGYPIFMAMVGSDRNIYVAQLLLGYFITLLLFWIAKRLIGSTWMAFVVALAHSFNLGQLFFEANLLTETLTTFWLVLTLATVLLLLNRQQPNIWFATGIGITSALTAITRPLFIYLPFWLLLFVVWHAVQSTAPTKERSTWLTPLFKRQIWSSIIVLLIPMALILGSWVAFIHDRYHMWSLTTMTGYHMIQHSGNFFEYLPNEYADLRDTYLIYRQAHIAEFGTQTNTIWVAIPEMQKVSGMTFYDLSRTLSRLSIWLIVRYPGLYLSNVIKGWWLFWRAPVYWQAEAFRVSTLALIASPVVMFERGLMMAANFVFIIASLPSLFIKRLIPIDPSKRTFLLCMVGTIWIGSIVQSLLDHGDNPRFLVPMQSLVVLWLLWFGHRTWLLVKKKI